MKSEAFDYSKLPGQERTMAPKRTLEEDRENLLKQRRELSKERERLLAQRRETEKLRRQAAEEEEKSAGRLREIRAKIARILNGTAQDNDPDKETPTETREAPSDEIREAPTEVREAPTENGETSTEKPKRESPLEEETHREDSPQETMEDLAGKEIEIDMRELGEIEIFTAKDEEIDPDVIRRSQEQLEKWYNNQGSKINEINANFMHKLSARMESSRTSEEIERLRLIQSEFSKKVKDAFSKLLALHEEALKAFEAKIRFANQHRHETRPNNQKNEEPIATREKTETAEKPLEDYELEIDVNTPGNKVEEMMGMDINDINLQVAKEYGQAVNNWRKEQFEKIDAAMNALEKEKDERLKQQSINIELVNWYERNLKHLTDLYKSVSDTCNVQLERIKIRLNYALREQKNDKNETEKTIPQDEMIKRDAADKLGIKYEEMAIINGNRIKSLSDDEIKRLTKKVFGDLENLGSSWRKFSKEFHPDLKLKKIRHEIFTTGKSLKEEYERRFKK